MEKINSKNGQSTIESLLSILVLIGVTKVLLIFLYLIFVRTWIDQHLYEATLCQNYNSQNFCKTTFFDRTNKGIVFGTLSNFKINKNSHQLMGKSRFQFDPFIKFEVEKQINLPLIE